jgi:ABC-type transporter MlaC component
MFVTQVGLIASIAWLGQTSVSGSGFPWQAFMLACVISLLSATQDIALDAFRREILPDEELGLGNAIHVNAYRIAGLIPGSLSLILADKMPWMWVFAITAVFMIPGLIMTLLVKEPSVAKGTPRTLRAAVVEPFKEFFGRHGLESALLMLAFLFFYKLGDSLCTALATPFYLDIGFSKTEIGIVAKNAGLWASVAGGILGGIWMIKLGINRALWLFGVVQLVSILGFATLAWMGPPFVAPKEHAGLTPDAFVKAVTADALANVCANRAVLTDNQKNSHVLVGNSLRRYFNFNHMAGVAAGSHWKDASTEQRANLADAFHSLLVRDWAHSVFRYCDWTVDIDTRHIDPNAEAVTVSTVIHREGAQPITMDYSLEIVKHRVFQPWKMLWNLLFESRELKDQNPEGYDPKKQVWRVLDITVDGQSLAESYRNLFADKINSEGGMGGLIDWIRKQIETDFWALSMLALVIGFEALGVGLGSAAFVAFMLRAAHPAYVATQLALFTSLMAVPRTFINAAAGWLVEGVGGWYPFFWLCFFLGIPGMLLLFKVAPWRGSPPTPAAASEEKAADAKAG